MTHDTIKIGFAIEGTYRTAEIDAIGDTWYRFGQYEREQTWESMTIENMLEFYETYNLTYPTAVDAGRNFPIWKHSFFPLTPQYGVFMLGKCTDSAPDTFEPYAVGTKKKSLTIRWEGSGGTYDRGVQAVGAYATEMYCRAMIGAPFSVQLGFVFSDLEDEGDSCEMLTASPTDPTGASEVYDGNPIVVYDDGGGGEATLTDIMVAEWWVKQKYKVVPDADKQGQAIYLYGFEPVDLTLTARMDEDNRWNDFVDLNTKDYSVKVQKPDGDHYTDHIFKNCKVVKQTYSSNPHKGLITAKLNLKAEYMTGAFTTDITDTWANHFKTAA